MTSIRFHRFVFPVLVLLLIFARPAVTLATTVRLATSFGAIDIVLYDAAAPLTVANFLTYVNSGAYGSSFVHRSVPGFVIQGGGFVWDDATSRMVAVPAQPPVPNEFSASRSNRRGTIAMALTDRAIGLTGWTAKAVPSRRSSGLSATRTSSLVGMAG